MQQTITKAQKFVIPLVIIVLTMLVVTIIPMALGKAAGPVYKLHKFLGYSFVVISAFHWSSHLKRLKHYIKNPIALIITLAALGSGITYVVMNLK